MFILNKKLKKKWDEAAFEFAKQIKKDDKPSVYSYMILSSATFIELFFTAVFSVKEEDFPFSTKAEYEKNLSQLKKGEIKSLYVFFLLDYFAFLKLEMHPSFFDVFPISYDDLLKGFKEVFKVYVKDLNLLDKTVEDFEKPFHPRTFLRRTGLPDKQDDTFLIYTLNELKFELFHQFNKNISRIIKAVGRGGNFN